MTIVAKFAFFNDTVLVNSLGKRLAGTKICINNQFLKEIAERRKVLYPLKVNRLKGKRVALVVDKLYIDNQIVPRHQDYAMASLRFTKFHRGVK